MHVQDGTIVKNGGVFIKGDLISWKIKTGTLQQSFFQTDHPFPEDKECKGNRDRMQHGQCTGAGDGEGRI